MQVLQSAPGGLCDQSGRAYPVALEAVAGPLKQLNNNTQGLRGKLKNKPNQKNLGDLLQVLLLSNKHGK